MIIAGTGLLGFVRFIVSIFSDPTRIMKFGLSLSLLAGLAAATPTPTENDHVDRRTVQKRAAITDACNIGFCTQNGG